MDRSKLISFLALVVVYAYSDTLPELKHEQFACYGDHPFYSFNNANCSSNEIIATIDVIVGSKRRNTCPQLLRPTDILTPENKTCCKPDNEIGCFGSLNASNSNFHFRENCTGRETCPKVQVGFIPTRELGCDSSVYYTDTHNFVMYYYCISEDKVGYIPNANLQNNGGSALYLLGQIYPAEINISASTCSIETDPGSFISVFALDVRLKEVNGSCQQSITIKDDSSQRTIDCTDNNLFNISVIYTSLSNILILEFSNNLETGGYFWLGFTASSNGTLSLSCNNKTTNEESTTVSMATDSSTEVTNKEITKTTSSESGVTNVPQTSKDNQDSSSVGMIAGVVAGLLLLLVLVIIICCCIYMKKKKKRGKENEDKKQPIEDNKDSVKDKDTSFPAVLFDQNLPQKQNVLPPISTMYVKSKDVKEKKSKKKKRRDRNHNSEQEIHEEFDPTNDTRSLFEKQNSWFTPNGYTHFEETEENNQNEEREGKKKHKKKKKRKKKSKIEPEDDSTNC